MHIMFFSHYFPPEGNAPASRLFENAKRWIAAGHRVTVVTCAPNVPDGVVYEGYRNTLKPQRESVEGIEVVRVWTYIAANKGTVKRIGNYVSYMISALLFSLFLRRPDVIVATSPQFFCGWAGLLASKLRRLPFILEIRDIWPESIAAVGAMKKSRLLSLLEWLELKMYAWSPHIVTVGEGYRRQLMDKGVPEEKLSVVMNGVDRGLFTPRPADPAIVERYGLAGKFVVSYVGTVGMACGLEIVLRAAARLREMEREDIVFMIVGDGAVREDLEAAARDRGLSNVIFTGRQPKEQMPNFLATAGACLVHLRKTDLFTSVMPSKIFEAAGMKRPIVNGVDGQARELVETAGAGLIIEPENDSQLVEVAIRLAGDPDLCRNLGETGHAYITRHFDRDRLAADYAAIVEQVAHRRPVVQSIAVGSDV